MPRPPLIPVLSVSEDSTFVPRSQLVHARGLGLLLSSPSPSALFTSLLSRRLPSLASPVSDAPTCPDGLWLQSGKWIRGGVDRTSLKNAHRIMLIQCLKCFNGFPSFSGQRRESLGLLLADLSSHPWSHLSSWPFGCSERLHSWVPRGLCTGFPLHGGSLFFCTFPLSAVPASSSELSWDGTALSKCSSTAHAGGPSLLSLCHS